MSQLTKNPLIISLDVDTKDEALKLVDKLSSVAGCFKLGPRLVYRYGDEIVRKISSTTPVFIDCKFFDIPSTMLAAVQACFDSGATLVTVHALAGLPALQELARLEQKLNATRPFKILCVTVLTSWDQSSVPTVLKSQAIASHVLELSQLVKKSGLTGLVCSAEELDQLKSQNHFLVVPGIRMAHHSLGDQKRVMSPKEAMQLGASCLVIGRPILAAKDPLAEAKLFLREIGI